MDNGSTKYALLVIYERNEKTTTGTLLLHKEIVRLLNGNERCKYLIILETDPISKKNNKREFGNETKLIDRNMIKDRKTLAVSIE